ncbi:MAG TPA: protein kinase [Sedimentisphaerales bacterium]|nr:protein kinase [Sedimentisphaerales bacterium]
MNEISVLNRTMNSDTINDIDSSVLHFKGGAHLGKYRLKRCLGTGGSCEVWQARDRVEGIWVALKIPLPGVNGRRDNESVLREVRSVCRLRHPNILSVKNADIIDGHAVLATELSTGTLADRSKPLAFATIVSIIIQVLKALAYAHQNRIVHCDVTPENIFLFPGRRAALGDFGISLKLTGRMKTVDDFGTPGYVAPEQAYGRPTYRSDCFAVAVILYEYLTGYLPCWPFNWPFHGYKRLRQTTNSAFAAFMKKSFALDPMQRFANAGKMLNALCEVIPESQRKNLALKPADKSHYNWRRLRREAFVRRYGRTFGHLYRCIRCGEPVSEKMLICPWCGSDRNRFDTRSSFGYVCPQCHRGVVPGWRFCPWCYGAGFDWPGVAGSTVVHYRGRCSFCGGKLVTFMRYCPWCHRKVRKPWRISIFPQACTRCRWSVDSEFWQYCPWCKKSLTALRA